MRGEAAAAAAAALSLGCISCGQAIPPGVGGADKGSQSHREVGFTITEETGRSIIHREEEDQTSVFWLKEVGEDSGRYPAGMKQQCINNLRSITAANNK